jgi:hypothetical protein
VTQTPCAFITNTSLRDASSVVRQLSAMERAAPSQRAWVPRPGDTRIGDVELLYRITVDKIMERSEGICRGFPDT